MFTKSENNSISICEVKLTFVVEGHCYKGGMPFHFDKKTLFADGLVLLQAF